MVSSSLSNAPNAKRVRVLQIVAGLDIGGRFGGAERAGVTLARHLDKSRFDVAVCAFWADGSQTEREWIERMRADGIPVMLASSPEDRRGTSDFLRPARRIVAWCRQNNIDIVHAHHPGGALAGLMAKIVGATRRVMRTSHMPVQLEWGTGFGGSLMRSVFSRSIFPMWLDAEIAVSQQISDTLAQRKWARLLGRPHGVIVNSVDLVLQPAGAGEMRRTSQKIGIVGRLSAQKNHRILIECMPAVLAALPDAKLLIAGEGELRDDLIALSRRLEVTHAVSFLGQLTPEEVTALLADIQLFVLPSLWEGVATALLEAAAAGVPAVVSDVPGNREVIPDEAAGWIVPINDAAALGEAVKEALGCFDAARQRAAVARHRLSRFDVASACQAYGQLYQDLVRM